MHIAVAVTFAAVALVEALAALLFKQTPAHAAIKMALSIWFGVCAWWVWAHGGAP